MARPDVWEGDFARALAALRPRDRETAAAIAGLLRLDPARRATSGQRTARSPTRTEPRERTGIRLPPLQPARRRPAADVDEGPRALQPIRRDDSGLRSSWIEAEPLERFSAAEHLARIPSYEPLLDRRWARQVLTTLLAMPRFDGPVDEAAVVESIARGEPVDPVPLLPRRSLSRGVHLLLDLGEGMQPFVRDAWHLADELDRVLGATNVDTRAFTEVPETEAAGDGRPVLALTDLGIAGLRPSERTAAGRRWLALAEGVRGGGAPLLALVPYPPNRWPPRLAQAMTIVQWDRSTSVSAVHTIRTAPR
jgi:hypothetical protein